MATMTEELGKWFGANIFIDMVPLDDKESDKHPQPNPFLCKKKTSLSGKLDPVSKYLCNLDGGGAGIMCANNASAIFLPSTKNQH